MDANELIELLQQSQWPPGAQLFVAVVPPGNSNNSKSVIGGKPKNYSKFVPTSEAVKIMETTISTHRLRKFANDSLNGITTGFKEGHHFKDLSSYGSSRARWVFHPERCDKFFGKGADSRVKPA